MANVREYKLKAFASQAVIAIGVFSMQHFYNLN
jgi:hypothetical protein